MRALQRGMAFQPAEPGKVSHDAGRDFPICLGTSNDNHSYHDTLLCGLEDSHWGYVGVCSAALRDKNYGLHSGLR